MPVVDLTLKAEPSALRLSPTDISQFVRLEQCERYLRLRLHERAHGRGFLRSFGVEPQAIPPLLTRSGSAFEQEVEQAVRTSYQVVHLGEAAAGIAQRGPDNDRINSLVQALPPGAVLFLFQARLQVTLGRWVLTGDADVIRLERGEVGALQVLIADMKSTTATRVEHRLQVAFYQAMLGAVFTEAGIVAEIGTAILYRGAEDGGAESEPDAERSAQEREDARQLFNVDACLARVADPQAYLDAVADLVTSPGSLAERVAGTEFDKLPFHLTYKCDGCLYNAFCMKWSVEQDDLSLIPHLTAGDKSALRRLGITTARELAVLKEPAPDPDELTPAPGKEELCRQVAVTWPVGPRLDELIHRARRYRKWRRDEITALPYIPSKGYGSLPYADAEQNPNLVRVYIDAQHDYLQDRVYLLGALVVACEDGVPVRRRSVVHLTPGPPDTAEKEQGLFGRWIEETRPGGG